MSLSKSAKSYTEEEKELTDLLKVPIPTTIDGLLHEIDEVVTAAENDLFYMTVHQMNETHAKILDEVTGEEDVESTSSSNSCDNETSVKPPHKIREFIVPSRSCQQCVESTRGVIGESTEKSKDFPHSNDDCNTKNLVLKSCVEQYENPKVLLQLDMNRNFESSSPIRKGNNFLFLQRNEVEGRQCYPKIKECYSSKARSGLGVGIKRCISPPLKEDHQDDPRIPSNSPIKLYKKRKIDFCHQVFNDNIQQKRLFLDVKLARRNFRGPFGIPIDHDSMVVVLDTTKAGTSFKYPIRIPEYRHTEKSLLERGRVCQKILVTVNIQERKVQAYSNMEDYIDLNDISLAHELNEEYLKIVDEGEREDECNKNIYEVERNFFNSPNRTITLIEGSPDVKYKAKDDLKKEYTSFLENVTSTDERALATKKHLWSAVDQHFPFVKKAPETQDSIFSDIVPLQNKTDTKILNVSRNIHCEEEYLTQFDSNKPQSNSDDLNGIFGCKYNTFDFSNVSKIYEIYEESNEQFSYLHSNAFGSSSPRTDKEIRMIENISELPICIPLEVSPVTSSISKVDDSKNNVGSDIKYCDKDVHINSSRTLEMGDVVGNNLAKIYTDKTSLCDETVNNTAALEDPKRNCVSKVEVDQISARETNALTSDKNSMEQTTYELQNISPISQLEKIENICTRNEYFHFIKNASNTKEQVNEVDDNSSLDDGNISSGGISTTNVDDIGNASCSTTDSNTKEQVNEVDDNSSLDDGNISSGGISTTNVDDIGNASCSTTDSNTKEQVNEVDDNSSLDDGNISSGGISTTNVDDIGNASCSTTDSNTKEQVNEVDDNSSLDDGNISSGGISTTSVDDIDNASCSTTDSDKTLRFTVYADFALISTEVGGLKNTATADTNSCNDYNSIFDGRSNDAVISAPISEKVKHSLVKTSESFNSVAEQQSNQNYSVNTSVSNTRSTIGSCHNALLSFNLNAVPYTVPAINKNVEDKSVIEPLYGQDEDGVILSSSNYLKKHKTAKRQTNGDENIVSLVDSTVSCKTEKENDELLDEHGDVIIRSDSDSDVIILSNSDSDVIILSDSDSDVVSPKIENKEHTEPQDNQDDIVNLSDSDEDLKTENATKSSENQEVDIVDLSDSSTDSVISIHSDNEPPAMAKTNAEEEFTVKSVSDDHSDEIIICDNRSKSIVRVHSNDSISSNKDLLDLKNYKEERINYQNANRITGIFNNCISSISSSISNKLLLPCSADCLSSANMSSGMTETFENLVPYNSADCSENISSRIIETCEHFENNCNKENVHKITPYAQDIYSNRIEFSSDENIPSTKTVIFENSSDSFYPRFLDDQDKIINVTNAGTVSSTSADSRSISSDNAGISLAESISYSKPAPLENCHRECAVTLPSDDSSMDISNNRVDLFILENVPVPSATLQDFDENATSLYSQGQNMPTSGFSITNVSLSLNDQYKKTNLVPNSVSMGNNALVYSSNRTLSLGEDIPYSTAEKIKNSYEENIFIPRTDVQDDNSLDVSNNCKRISANGTTPKTKDFCISEIIPCVENSKENCFSRSRLDDRDENVRTTNVITSGCTVLNYNNESLLANDDTRKLDAATNETFKKVANNNPASFGIWSSENLMCRNFNEKSNTNSLDYQSGSTSTTNITSGTSFDSKNISLGKKAFQAVAERVEKFKEQHFAEPSHANGGGGSSVDGTIKAETSFNSANVFPEDAVSCITIPTAIAEHPSTSKRCKKYEPRYSHKQNNTDIFDTSPTVTANISPGFSSITNISATPTAKIEFVKEVAKSVPDHPNDDICNTSTDMIASVVLSPSENTMKHSFSAVENLEQNAQICKNSACSDNQPCSYQYISNITSNNTANYPSSTSDSKSTYEVQSGVSKSHSALTAEPKALSEMTVINTDVSPPAITTEKAQSTMPGTKPILELPHINSEIGARPGLLNKTSCNVPTVSLDGFSQVYVPTVNLDFDSVTVSQHDRSFNASKNCTVTSSEYSNVDICHESEYKTSDIFTKHDCDNYSKGLEISNQANASANVALDASHLKNAATPTQTAQTVEISNPPFAPVGVLKNRNTHHTPSDDSLTSKVTVPSSDTINAPVITTGVKRPIPSTREDSAPSKKYKSSSNDSLINQSKLSASKHISIVNKDVDDQELADNNDPRWKLFDFNEPQDCFLAVCNQWCTPMPNPHDDLTVRFSKMKPNSHFRFPGNTKQKTIECWSVYKDQLLEINAESTKLKRMLDIQGPFWRQSRINQTINKLRELDNILNDLRKAWDEAFRFYTFYKSIKSGENAWLITEFKKNEIKRQFKMLNSYEGFYGNSD